MVGYFEGIGSQRGIAWRCGESLSLREFLGIPLTEDTPDHSSLTRVRDRLPLEIHTTVFQLVLKLAAEKGLIKGKTVAVDSATLEANAAMKFIVRRDTGEDWNEYLRSRVGDQEIGGSNPPVLTDWRDVGQRQPAGHRGAAWSWEHVTTLRGAPGFESRCPDLIGNDVGKW